MKNVEMKKLPNGLSLLNIKSPGSKTATILVIFKTGSKYESREISGLSHFVEHVMFKGTKKRPNTLTLASDLDALGGEYNAFTSKEHTGYFVKVENSQILKAAEIISDMLINSKFDAKEIAREKGVIIEEINMYEDDPRSSLEDVFEGVLYGDTPAGWEVIGTKENIRRFTRADFMKYYNSQYVASNGFICLAGDLPFRKMELELAKLFKSCRRGKAQGKLAVVEKQTAPVFKVKQKKTDQMHLSLGVRIGQVNDPLAPAWRVLAMILGGSMSSRLFVNLRERQGLAYYVRTQVEFLTDSAYLTTASGIRSSELELAVKIIMKEYREMTQKLVPLKELNRVKDMYRGRLFMGLESSDSLAYFYAKQIVVKGEAQSPEEIWREIKKVTPQDIRRAAQQVFKDQGLNLAIIGQVNNEAKIKQLLKF
ncbi:MAG TPA: pitrilysin family protein [bacterium]|nr:pitrilysin family protein [bacterium]HPT29357.1 pitrilysin family protein [bacterium]